MATYRILKETAPDEFTPTGETFDGAMEEVNAHLEQLRQTDGGSYAAEEVTPLGP